MRTVVCGTWVLACGVVSVSQSVGPAAAPRRGRGARLGSVVPVAPGRVRPWCGQGMVYWTDWPHRSKPGVSWPVLRRRGRCRCRVSCRKFAMCKKPVPHRARCPFGGASVEDWGGRLRDTLWTGALPGNGGKYGTPDGDCKLRPQGAPLLQCGGISGNHPS